MRTQNGKCRLEFPTGKVLYETADGSATPGSRPTAPGSRSWTMAPSTMTADPSPWSTAPGRRRRSRPSTRRRTGSPGRPTARRSGTRRRRSAATVFSIPPRLSGRTRTLARVAGSLTLQDVTRDGRVLISHDTGQIGILARGAADAKESRPELARLEPYRRHLRRRAPPFSSAKRARAAERATRSTCARWTVRRRCDWERATPSPFRPTASACWRSWARPMRPRSSCIRRAPAKRRRSRPAVSPFEFARWLPDGRHFLAVGRREGARGPDVRLRRRRRRAAAADAGGLPAGSWSRRTESASPYGVRRDAAFVVSIDGGEPKPVPGFETSSSIAGWTPDGRLLVRKGTSTEMPMRLFALDPGHRTRGALARVLSGRRDRRSTA